MLYAVLLVVLLTAGGAAATRWEWLRGPEDFYYDLWHQLAGHRYEPRHTAIVAIDDQTRLAHQDEPLAFWSPHFARAISVLRQAGARVIGLDFVFIVSPEAWLKKLKLPESHLSRTFDLDFRKQLAAGRVVLAGDLALDAQNKTKLLLPPPDYWGSLPGGLEDVGLVNLFFRDPDGAVRRAEPAYPLRKGAAWATFAQLLAARASEGNRAGRVPPPVSHRLRRPPGHHPPGLFPALA